MMYYEIQLVDALVGEVPATDSGRLRQTGRTWLMIDPSTDLDTHTGAFEEFGAQHFMPTMHY